MKMDRGNSVKKERVVLGIGFAAVIVIIAVVVFAVIGKGGAASKAYSTPEKAVKAYGEAIAVGNIEEALGVFDTQEKAKGISLKKYITRMQSFIPSAMPAASGDKYQLINEAEFRGTAASQTKLFIYSLLPGEKIQESVKNGNVVVDGADAAGSLMEELKLDQLKKLSVKQVDVYDQQTQESKRYQSNNKDVCKIYGCKDIKEYAALFQLGDQYYQGYFTVAEYEAGWKIMSLSASEGESQGVAQATTEEEYKSMLKEKE